MTVTLYDDIYVKTWSWRSPGNKWKSLWFQSGNAFNIYNHNTWLYNNSHKWL